MLFSTHYSSMDWNTRDLAQINKYQNNKNVLIHWIESQGYSLLIHCIGIHISKKTNAPFKGSVLQYDNPITDVDVNGIVCIDVDVGNS